MNLYFSATNRAAVKPMEQVFNPLLYGVGATPGWIEQPHFGFSKQSFLEVNTSVPLMVLWVLVLGYGYIQARRGLMSKDSLVVVRAPSSSASSWSARLYLYGSARRSSWRRTIAIDSTSSRCSSC